MKMRRNAKRSRDRAIAAGLALTVPMLSIAVPAAAAQADEPIVLAQMYRPPQNQQADPNAQTDEEKQRRRDGRRGGQGGMSGMSGQGDQGGQGGMSGQGGMDGRSRRNRDGGMGGMSGQGGQGGMSGQGGMEGGRRMRGEDRGSRPPANTERTTTPETTQPAPKVQQQVPVAPKTEPPVSQPPKVQTPPVINQKSSQPETREERNRDGDRKRTRDRDQRDATPTPPPTTPQATTAPTTAPKGDTRDGGRTSGERDGDRNRDRPFKIERRNGDRDGARDDQRDAKREKFEEQRGSFKFRERKDDGERRRDRQERFEVQRKEGFGNLDALRQRRTERTLDGGRKILVEPDNRRIIRSDGRAFITHDETRRFRRFDRDASVRRRPDGRNITTIVRPNGVQIISETSPDGHLIRRYRRTRDGREIMLIDNRRTWRKWGAIGAGAAVAGLLVAIGPPRYHGPRERYIIDYERASDDDIYDALIAPPIDRLDRGYTLDEVLGTYNLRERMRRVDLDSINFEFGSWEVGEGQYEKLERAARAIGRIIDRNSDEVILIEGYTDAVGDEIDNLSLSDRRAEEVANILTEEFDIPPENLVTQGYGEQFLKVDTDGPERANRRVTVRRITPLLERRLSRRYDDRD